VQRGQHAVFETQDIALRLGNFSGKHVLTKDGVKPQSGFPISRTGRKHQPIAGILRYNPCGNRFTLRNSTRLTDPGAGLRPWWPGWRLGDRALGLRFNTRRHFDRFRLGAR
jgi:hypothetical protein